MLSFLIYDIKKDDIMTLNVFNAGSILMYAVRFLVKYLKAKLNYKNYQVMTNNSCILIF